MQFPALPNPVDDPGLQANLEYIARYLIPPGLGPLPWPSDTVPPFGAATWRESGWVLLSGTKYKIDEYSGLYRILGTKYNIGGEAADEFRVPDMRGRVPVGMDNIGGADAGLLAVANTIGLTGGAETHTLTTAQMPSHSHGGVTGNDSPDHFHGTGGIEGVANNGGLDVNGAFIAGWWRTGVIVNNTAGANTRHTHSITAEGGGTAHNNMPPYILTYYIMKA